MNRIPATGFNLPPYFLNNRVVFINYDRESGKMAIADDYSGIRYQSPLVFKSASLPPFTFPIDPFISLSFKNTIIRRHVAKGSVRGTVKERWTQDDVEITISGVFVNDQGDALPEEIGLLHEYFNLNASIEVECEVLNERFITEIVIESFDLPHTKGMENQAYQIKAYSDDVFELLKEMDNAV